GKCATRRATLRMRSTVPTEVPPYFWTIRAMTGATSRSDRAEGERGVRPAEAEGIRQRRADGHFARSVRHEIQVALRVLLEQIRRGRRDLIAQRQRGEHGLDAARGAEQVTG